MAEKEYIDRQSTVDALARLCKRVCQYSEKQRQFMCGACPLGDAFTVIEDDLPAADVRPVPEGGIGEMSDGYHTFNGLYYQRMILFAALVKAYKDKAWKSHRHEDGELCFGGGWFIVGIDTPEGSYTYHYDDTVWDFFDCEELPTAKHWDGHTEEDVTRLLSLDVKPRWIPVTEQLPEEGEFVLVHGNLYPNKHDGGVIAVSKRMDWNYWQGFGREIDITHWMPLPSTEGLNET